MKFDSFVNESVSWPENDLWRKKYFAPEWINLKKNLNGLLFEPQETHWEYYQERKWQVNYVNICVRCHITKPSRSAFSFNLKHNCADM